MMRKIPSWKPPALEGFKPVPDTKERGKWNWVKKIEGSEKSVVIPEYEIVETSREALMLTEQDRKMLIDVEWVFVPVVVTSFWGMISRAIAQILQFCR
jgi:hypothetical protein